MNNGLNRSRVALAPGESFDTVVLPHLEAAHRLARSLMRDADVAEEASADSVGSVPTSKVIGVTAMAPACAAS